MGCAVAEGLAAAHEAGFLHRDLKSDNVMIGEHGAVKLLDFGLAKSLRKESQDQTLTREGKIIGTVSAMSPEQATGEPLDERSDLFSFGILLYEAATGVSPFQTDHSMQTLANICRGTQVPAIDRNAEVPLELSKLIDHLLEKEPDERPQIARDVLASLRRIAGSGKRRRRTDDPPDPSGRHAADGATRERRPSTVPSAALANGDGGPLDSSDCPA